MKKLFSLIICMSLLFIQTVPALTLQKQYFLAPPQSALDPAIFEKMLFNKQEIEDAAHIARQLHTPLNANGNAEMAKRYLEGGYEKDGYGVPEGAAVDGSFTIDDEGNQGYFIYRGKKIFLTIVNNLRDFFVRRAQRLGKRIRYIIKPGIGGQHIPFQGIAEVFQVIDPASGMIVGEYEIGKDYEASLTAVLKALDADWDEIAVIPSSKSGSTDETMLIFEEIFHILLKHIAIQKGIDDGEKFADIVFDTMHEVNFPQGKERPGAELFKGFNLALVQKNCNKEGLTVSYDEVKNIFGIVLGNMFFETTDRPSKSRLSAFIRNSGLDKELGIDAPGFGAMNDNVGGRWTAEPHMMTYLAYHNLDADAYWEARYNGIKKVRSGNHPGVELGNDILNNNITDIAFVVPDEMFWFGKAIEQNFNESIWQEGFVNLVAIKQSKWQFQRQNYVNDPHRLIINLGSEQINDAKNLDLCETLHVDNKQSIDKETLPIMFANLFTTFYAMTHTVGNRLIARAIRTAGLQPENVDIHDLDNPATKILQENLYLRQPYVELGKGLLEDRLSKLQEREKNKSGAIIKAEKRIKKYAKQQAVKSNIPGINISKIGDRDQFIQLLNKAYEYAKQEKRKFVPFIYLGGDKYYNLRDNFVKLGLEWIMQGSGDQHISFQQVLKQPKKYLPFIISFVPDEFQPGRPAIGFAKPYLHNISPTLVRDYFGDTSYNALTKKRKKQGGKGVFMWMQDTDENRYMFLEAVINSKFVQTNFTVSAETIVSVLQSAKRAPQPLSTHIPSPKSKMKPKRMNNFKRLSQLLFSFLGQSHELYDADYERKEYADALTKFGLTQVFCSADSQKRTLEVDIMHDEKELFRFEYHKDTQKTDFSYIQLRKRGDKRFIRFDTGIGNGPLINIGYIGKMLVFIISDPAYHYMREQGFDNFNGKTKDGAGWMILSGTAASDRVYVHKNLKNAFEWQKVKPSESAIVESGTDELLSSL